MRGAEGPRHGAPRAAGRAPGAAGYAGWWVALCLFAYIVADKAGQLCPARAPAPAPAPARRLSAGEGGGEAAPPGGAQAEDGAGDAPAAHGESEDPHGAEESAEEVAQSAVIPYLFLAIGVGTLLVHATSHPLLHGLQQTVVIFFLGVLYSIVIELGNIEEFSNGGLGMSYRMWMDIRPELLLSVMLPVLITGDAMTIDTSVARRVGMQCLYLAGPGVLIGSMLLAALVWAYMAIVQWNWSFLLCLTMASILSATDPVAVVSLLRELGASPTLTVQIQGESLLNDGTSIVLYTVAYAMLGGERFTAGDIIIIFGKAVVCAVVLGLAFGGISVWWIRKAANRLDPERSSLIQISVTLTCAYLSFVLAEGTFRVSGVLCTVAASLVLADKMWPSIVSKEAMHNVWHVFEHIGNSIIFFVAGSLMGSTMVNIGWRDYLHLLVIYFLCIAVRMLILYFSMPVLNYLGSDEAEDLTTAEAVVMCWGGLRGALGLCLAIEVHQSKAGGMLTDGEAKRVLFYVGGIALLTLAVNATTCPILVKWLKLNRPSGTKRLVRLNLLRHISDFASKQPATDRVGNHLDQMLEEVRMLNDAERDFATSSTPIPGGMRLKKEPSDKRRAPLGDGSPAAAQPPQGPRHQQGRCGSWCAKYWPRFEQPKKQLRMQTAVELLWRLKESRRMFSKIPSDNFELLGLPANMSVAQQEQSVRSRIQEGGDSVSSEEMKPVNEIFLSLVEAKYWKRIDSGDFTKGAGADLLETIVRARSEAGAQLCDLRCLRQRLLLRQVNDEEATRLTLLTGYDGAAMAIEEETSVEAQMTSRFSRQMSKKLDLSGTRSVAPKTHAGLMQMVHSYAYSCWALFVSTSVTVCALIVALTTEPGTEEHLGILGIVVHVLFMLEVLDFCLKVSAYQQDFFTKIPNRLDAGLTFLAAGAIIFEIAASGSHDSAAEIFLGTPVTQWIRGAAVMQVLRVHKLTHAVHAWAGLKRMTTSSSLELAGRIQAITQLTALANAHVESQDEVLKYFGNGGAVTTAPLARCMAESMTEVRRACFIAYSHSRLVHSEIKNALLSIRVTIANTTKLCELVEEARASGVVSEGDAESLLHPLRYQLKDLQQMRRGFHIGVIPAQFKNIVAEAHASMLEAGEEMDAEEGDDSEGSAATDPGSWREDGAGGQPVARSQDGPGARGGAGPAASAAPGPPPRADAEHGRKECDTQFSFSTNTEKSPRHYSVQEGAASGKEIAARWDAEVSAASTSDVGAAAAAVEANAAAAAGDPASPTFGAPAAGGRRPPGLFGAPAASDPAGHADQQEILTQDVHAFGAAAGAPAPELAPRCPAPTALHVPPPPALQPRPAQGSADAARSHVVSSSSSAVSSAARDSPEWTQGAAARPSPPRAPAGSSAAPPPPPPTAWSRGATVRRGHGLPTGEAAAANDGSGYLDLPLGRFERLGSATPAEGPPTRPGSPRTRQGSPRTRQGSPRTRQGSPRTSPCTPVSSPRGGGAAAPGHTAHQSLRSRGVAQGLARLPRAGHGGAVRQTSSDGWSVSSDDVPRPLRPAPRARLGALCV